MLPRALQPRQPVGLSVECDDEEPQRQPVPVPAAWFETLSLVLEEPLEVLQPPLVRADLPASVKRCRDPRRALEVCMNGGVTRAG